MTRGSKPFTVADFYQQIKRNEFYRAALDRDAAAMYFLWIDNDFLKQEYPFAANISVLPHYLEAHRFQAKFRDLARAIFFNDHASVRYCLNEYPQFRHTYGAQTDKGLIDLLCIFSTDVEMAKIIIGYDQTSEDAIFDQDRNGKSPLDLASFYGRDDLLEFFSTIYYDQEELAAIEKAAAIEFVKQFNEAIEEMNKRIEERLGKSDLLDEKAQVLEEVKTDIVDLDALDFTEEESFSTKGNQIYDQSLPQDYSNFGKENTDTKSDISDLTEGDYSSAFPYNEIIASGIPQVEAYEKSAELKNILNEKAVTINGDPSNKKAIKRKKAKEEKKVIKEAQKLTNEERAIAKKEQDLIEELKQMMVKIISSKQTDVTEIDVFKQALDASNLHNKSLDFVIQDQDQSTLLILACRNGKFDIADLLMERGAKTKVFDQYSRSPLHHCALQKGKESFETAKIILEKTNNNKKFLDTKDNLGWSVPLCCATSNGNELILEEILKSSVGYTHNEQAAFFTQALYHENREIKNLFIKGEFDFKPTLEYIREMSKRISQKKAADLNRSDSTVLGSTTSNKLSDIIDPESQLSTSSITSKVSGNASKPQAKKVSKDELSIEPGK